MTEKFDTQIIQKIDCIQSRIEKLDKENQDYDKLIFEKIQQISILERKLKIYERKLMVIVLNEKYLKNNYEHTTKYQINRLKID